jgi:hypothetical protein
MWSRWRSVACILLSLAVALAAKQKPPQSYVKPDQFVEIANAPQTFAVADKPQCANYGWAAAVNTLLAADKVKKPQSYWVVKTSGGDRCFPQIDDPAAFTKAITGDYTLDDGRRIKISAEFTSGVPTNMDALISGLQAGRTAMMLFDHRVMLLKAVKYDDILRTYRDHYTVAREIHLVDPMQPAGARNRVVIFTRDKDDSARFQGVITLTVKDLQLGQLSEGYSN